MWQTITRSWTSTDHAEPVRQRAVELARQGGAPIAKIAEDLGISESRLRNWLHADVADDNGASSEKKKGYGTAAP